jgi:predicted DNA-binding transcriptional regulator AlpA
MNFSNLIGLNKNMMDNKNQHNGELLRDAHFLRLSQILKLIPVGKTTWWNGVKSGRFPKPVKLGERITAWKAEDIKNLINSFAHIV